MVRENAGEDYWDLVDKKLASIRAQIHLAYKTEVEIRQAIHKYVRKFYDTIYIY